jgi:hypothetical protein
VGSSVGAAVGRDGGGAQVSRGLTEARLILASLHGRAHHTLRTWGGAACVATGHSAPDVV